MVAVWCLGFTTPAFSQKSDSLYFKFRDLPLDSILNQVSDMCGYYFSYNSDILPKGSLFTYNKKNTLSGFLDEILTGTRIIYSFYEDQIILRNLYHDWKWFTISGTVLDEETGVPLSGVNIYLDGTLLGSVSDTSGYYKIDRIPLGTYTVVFSYVGYKLKAYKLTSRSPNDRLISTSMVRSVIELDSIHIRADPIGYLTRYLRYISKFYDNFLGFTENANKCKILNPEVLIYNEYRGGEHIIIKASEPLVIQNDALGYEIYYDLESYIDDNDTVFFYGKARFKELPAGSKRTEKSRAQKRDNAYNGSMKHLLLSLITNSTAREGFMIFRVEGDSLSETSIREVENVSRLIEQTSKHSYELRLSNPTFVVYTKEKDKRHIENRSTEDLIEKYGQSSALRDFLRKYKKHQVSALESINDPVIIDENGNFKTPLNYITHGYLSLERTADLLPINY